MNSLHIYQSSSWSLDEFVVVANELLPQYLPHDEEKPRVLEDVNPRLVRYYVSSGLVDKPERVGREVRYHFRHLLQLLVVRQLLMSGYTSVAIAKVMEGLTDEGLLDLLKPGATLPVTAMTPSQSSNPALAFLQTIQHRATSKLESKASDAPPRERPVSHWLHIEIAPGLVLQVRRDFVFPVRPIDQQQLQERIMTQLSRLKWK